MRKQGVVNEHEIMNVCFSAIILLSITVQIAQPPDYLFCTFLF